MRSDGIPFEFTLDLGNLNIVLKIARQCMHASDTPLVTKLPAFVAYWLASILAQRSDFSVPRFFGALIHRLPWNKNFTWTVRLTHSSSIVLTTSKFTDSITT